MSWPMVKLDELCEINIGKTPSRAANQYWGLGFPWLSIADMNQGRYISHTKEQITELAVAETNIRLVPAGTVLFSFKLSIGKIGLTQIPMYTNEAIAALPIKDESKLCKEYLVYALAMMNFGKSADRAVMGATLNKKKLAELALPVPPLAEQKRIAAILDKADAIRSKRQQAIQLADDFLRAVFLEMFGDPVMNPKGWAISSLTAHGSFKNGLNFGRGESGHSLRYLGVGDFKSLSTIDDIGSLGSVTLDSLPGKDYLLENGDLVFVRSNGNKELVGRCITIYPDGEPLTFSGFCIRYRIEDDSVASEYLNYLFRTPSMKQTMLKGGQGANIQNINQKILGALEFPLPPKALQEKFSKIVQTYRGSKLNLDCGFVHAESLFAAIGQKAFSGNL